MALAIPQSVRDLPTTFANMVKDLPATLNSGAKNLPANLKDGTSWLLCKGYCAGLSVARIVFQTTPDYILALFSVVTHRKEHSYISNFRAAAFESAVLRQVDAVLTPLMTTAKKLDELVGTIATGEGAEKSVNLNALELAVQLFAVVSRGQCPYVKDSFYHASNQKLSAAVDQVDEADRIKIAQTLETAGIWKHAEWKGSSVDQKLSDQSAKDAIWKILSVNRPESA